MAIELGSAYISILPSTDKLASGIRRELSSVERSTSSSGSKAGKGWMGGFGAAVKTGMKTGVFAAFAGGSLLAGAGLKTAADLEQATIGFETMLGSAQRANKFLDQIKKTAANTPFELKGLTQSSQKLLAFGFQAKDVIPTLTTLGDAASGLGLGQEGLDRIVMAVGQIQAKGKVQGEELLQLTEAGIPAQKILQNELGLTADQYADLQKKGKILATDAIPALLNGIKNGTRGQAGETAKFGGLMAKQSKSLAGLFSTLKDTALVGMADALKPLIPLIKQGLAGGIKLITPLFGDLAKGIRLVKGFFNDGGGLGLGDWSDTLHDTWDALKKFGTDLWPTIKEIAGAVKDAFGGALSTVAEVIKRDFLPSVQAFLPVIEPVAKFLLNLFGDALIGVLKGAAQAIKGFFKIISGIMDLIVDLVHGNWSEVWDDFKKIFSGALDLVLGAFKVWWNAGILSLFRKGVAKLLFGWKDLGKKLLDIGKKSLDLVGKAFTSAFKLITGIFVKGIKAYLGYWTNLFKGLKAAGAAGWKVIQTGFTTALNAVKTAFSRGVEAIKSVWNGIKEAAAAPVRFVVETVYNNGIRKVVNAIPGVPDLPTLSFATGGVLPGYTPGRDVHDFYSPTAGRLRLSGGEGIMRPEWVRAMGGPAAVERMNAAARHGRFRRGGDIGAFASGGSLPANLLQAAASFAQAQVGKPYVWGGVGPGGYDCSGFMSAITNILRGQSPYSRVGATGSFPWAGFQPGVGQFTIGSTPNYGGSGVGHMAGTLMGMNVESRGGVGPITGSAARGYMDSGFTQVAHLGAGGMKGLKFGAFLDAVNAVKSFARSMGGWVSELAHMGGWGGMIRQMIAGVGASFRGWVNGKVPGPGPIPGGIFDSGGILEPGTFAFNASKKPEAVFNHRQFASLVDGVGGTHGPKRVTLSVGERDFVAYMTEVADDAINGDRAFRNTTRRMR